MVTVTKYVWDPVFDYVSHELDENNAVKAVYNNEPQQYGGVLGQRRGTTSHYYHHDALGSTRFLTDSSGNVTDTYLNDAWGNSVAQTGTTVNPFKWVGKYGYYTDDSTAQVYVRARMYEPVVARWRSVDPIFSFTKGMAYLVVLNRPVAYFDASGLIPQDNVAQRYCGPDTTKWFDSIMQSLFKQIDGFDDIWMPFRGGAYGTFWPSLKFENVLTPMVTSGICPCGSCGNTVILCNLCIDVTELGNIAAGALGGLFKIKHNSLGAIDNGVAHLFGALRIAAKNGRGPEKMDDLIGLLSGIQMFQGSGYPARGTLCSALAGIEPDGSRKTMNPNAIIDELRSYNAIPIVGGGLDLWNKNVGSKMQPPTTWDKWIREAIDRMNTDNNIPNHPRLGLGATHQDCLPCGVVVDGPAVLIQSDGTPVWSGDVIFK